MNADPLSGLLPWLFSVSLRASLAALVILAIQKALSGQLPARWRFGLWLPFVLMLLLPALPGSPLSLERLWPAGSVATDGAANKRIVPTLIPIPGLATAEEANKMETPPAGLSAWQVGGIIWLVGFGGVVGVGLLAYRRQMRRIRRVATEISPALRDEVRIAAAAVGLKSLPEILCSKAVESPAVTGPWRAVLLLPAGFPGNLSSREASLILRHEALHLKHRDAAWDLMFWLLNAAHWFNPLIWIAFIRLRSDRETARDAGVLAEAGPEDRAAYGGALLRLQLPPGSPLFQTGFVGLVNGGGGMRRRIAGLAHHRRISKAWHLAGVAMALMIQLTVGSSAAPKTPAPAPVGPAVPAVPDSAVVAKAKTLIIDRAQFDHAAVEEVVGYIRRKSMDIDTKEADPAKKGVNLILAPGGKMKPGATVTLDLRNVSVYELLSVSAESVGLQAGPSAEGNAILIAPAEKFEGTKPVTPAKPGDTSAVSKLAAGLMVPQIQFENASAEQVAAYLQRKSRELDPAGKGIKVVVALGAGKGKPVTLDIRNVSVLNLAGMVADISGLALEDDGTALKFVARRVQK